MCRADPVTLSWRCAGYMDSEKKRDWIKTAVIVVFFMVVAVVVLNIFIGASMEPLPPRR